MEGWFQDVCLGKEHVLWELHSSEMAATRYPSIK